MSHDRISVNASSFFPYSRMLRQKRKTEDQPVGAGEVVQHKEYPHILNMYSEAPQIEITMEQFEQWALDRLRVLMEIDALAASNRLAALDSEIKLILRKYLPLNSDAVKTCEAERRKDHCSHFILRLAFCKSAELRAKFVRLETILFEHRFRNSILEDRKGFVESLNLGWREAPEEEREYYKNQLRAASPKQQVENRYFKIEFTNVPALVGRREVFLHKGFAFVPESQELSIISSEFATRLEKAMLKTSCALPQLNESERLEPILDSMAEFQMAPNRGRASVNTGDSLTSEMLASLEKENYFPLCISNIHRDLIKTGESKFKPRTEYLRFQKHIGLSLDEALKFWRRSRRCTEEKFKSEYEYYIRHQYGTIGSRIQYRAMSCVEMAKDTDPHVVCGCAYKSMRPVQLEARLKDLNITDKADLLEIKNYVEQGHYNLACTKVFTLTHPTATTNGEIIESPVEYFGRAWLEKKDDQ